MTGPNTHSFRISWGKTVQREIEIVSTKKLYDLAEAIVQAFDFDFDHAFGFYSLLKGNVLLSPVKYELFVDMSADDVGRDARSVKRSRIVDAFPGVGSKMTFLFDSLFETVSVAYLILPVRH